MRYRNAAPVLLLLSAPQLACGQERQAHVAIGTPEALAAKHHRLHEQLVAATKLSGPVGDAMRPRAAGPGGQEP